MMKQNMDLDRLKPGTQVTFGTEISRRIALPAGPWLPVVYWYSCF